MKYIIYFVILIFIPILISSCNKDNPVSPGGGGPVEKYNYVHYSNAKPVLLNTNGVTYDTINCYLPPMDTNGQATLTRNITLYIDSSLLDATKLQIELIHTNTYGVDYNNLVFNALTHPGPLLGTVITDSASVYIESTNDPTYTGRYKPKKPLNSYVNSTPTGNWILKITYTGLEKSGVIKSWSVGISYNSLQQQTPVGQLLPLFVGNYWVYTNDTLTNAPYDTLFTPDYRWIHGLMTYKWIWGRYHLLDPNFYWCSNNDVEGFKGYGNYYDSSMGTILFFRYPDYIGDTNITKYWLSGVSSYNDTIICSDTNATVSTPLGIYTGCMVYKEKSSTWKTSQFNKSAFKNDNTMGTPTTYIYYFKPGVGLLGQDQITPTATYYLRLSFKRVQ